MFEQFSKDKLIFHKIGLVVGAVVGLLVGLFISSEAEKYEIEEVPNGETTNEEV